MAAELVVTAAVFLATFMLFFGIRLWAISSRPAERLQESLDATPPAGPRSGYTRRDHPVSGLAARLNALILRQGFAGELALSLSRANLRLTVPEYVLILIGCTCITALTGNILTGNVAFMVVFGALGFLAPGRFLKWRQTKRLHAFERQLPDVLSLMVGSLRAGYGLLQAVDMVAKEAAPPASEELGRVVRDVSIGLSLPDALGNLRQRVPSDDLSFIVTAIRIQHELGGNIASILETISHTIRERVRIQGEIRVLTTQQRWTGYLLTLLPFILGIILFILNPRYMVRLFDPGIVILPLAAVVMIFTGFLMIRKIVAIDV